jgi:hypothetical protein
VFQVHHERLRGGYAQSTCGAGAGALLTPLVFGLSVQEKEQDDAVGPVLSQLPRAVQVPVGVSGGQAFELTYQNRTFRVSCPPGARPGDTITVRLQVAKGAPPILRPAPRAATRHGASWIGGRPTDVRYSDTDPQYVGNRALSPQDGGDDLDRLDPYRQRPFWPFHLFGERFFSPPSTRLGLLNSALERRFPTFGLSSQAAAPIPLRIPSIACGFPPASPWPYSCTCLPACPPTAARETRGTL